MSTPLRGAAHWSLKVLAGSNTPSVQVGPWLVGGVGGETEVGGVAVLPPPPPPHAVSIAPAAIKAAVLVIEMTLDFGMNFTLQ